MIIIVVSWLSDRTNDSCDCWDFGSFSSAQLQTKSILTANTVHIYTVIIIQVVHKCPALHATQRFTTVFTWTHRWSPVVRYKYSVHNLKSYVFQFNFNIILSARPTSSKQPFPHGIPTKMLYVFFLSPKHVTCPVHFTVFYFINLITFHYKHRI